MQILPFVVKTGDLTGGRDGVAPPVRALNTTGVTSVKRVTRQAPMLRHAILLISVFHEESRGAVTLRPADPQDAPVIDFNLQSEPVDRARMHQAIRLANELF